MNHAEISILLVEDESFLRSLYAKVLESYTVYKAKNGEEGLKLFLEYRPDIVVTDIKMPIMNGLQMIECIKREALEARIVLISASNESRHFLEAIELGVKGYLLKPFDNSELKKTIDDISNDIFLSRKIKQAEIEITKNQEILKTINDISELLMRQGYNEKNIYTSLEMLGKTLRVSRVYIYENKEGNYKYLQEWAAPNIKKLNEYRAFNSFALNDISLLKFSENNINKNSFLENIEMFPENTRNYLEEIDVKTILIIKISVKNQWQGFIGFDTCTEKRDWSESERTSLETVGKIIGAAIYRSQIENELKDLTVNLENKVKQRTKELAKEVSERKVSEERYRLIFENANDGILISINGNIQLINPKITEITGYIPKELIGKNVDYFLAKEYKANAQAYFETDSLEENATLLNDVKIYDKNGNEKWVEINTSEMILFKKKAFLSFISNITQRKSYEKQLRNLNSDLERKIQEGIRHIKEQDMLLSIKTKTESLGELHAYIAHELNQPITGLSMSLENMLFHLAENQNDIAYVQKKSNLMFQDIERMRVIINDILNFSRKDDNEEDQPIELAKIIESSITFYKGFFSKHNIALRSQIQSGEYFSMGKSLQLELVLLNLLRNAHCAVEQKAKKTDKHFEKEVIISLFQENDQHIIEVWDNGVGIPKKNQKKIFEMLFTTQTKSKGMGLGLSLSKMFIEEMNGQIVVDSIENKYTKMKVILPMCDKP